MQNIVDMSIHDTEQSKYIVFTNINIILWICLCMKQQSKYIYKHEHNEYSQYWLKVQVF